ncbi:uncharacterized protein J3R85_004516 [Psidium guajava]|nr:uncharacterized protein J3R85_004516 [Psidium guajava]
MSSAFSKADDNSVAVSHGKQISEDGELEEEEEEEEEKEITTDNVVVTSHVHLKPAHSSQVLDRDTVLRRIRLRKRMNRFRASVQSLLGSSPGTSATVKKAEKASVTSNTKRWIDDAFAAP